MSSAIALAVASFCLTAVAALFTVAVAVITYLIHKSLCQDNKQEPLMHTHLSSASDSSNMSQNQLAVYDLTSPVRPQKSRESETQDDRSRRSPMNDHGSVRGRCCNDSIDSSQRAGKSPRAMPPSHPSHVQAEIANPATNLEEMRKGYAALLACKFTGDFAAHLSNVSAVTDSYNMDVDDICYCFLCLEAITNSEGVDGLAIKPYNLNSYSARIWIVSLARFVKFAQGYNWAEDGDRVRPLAEEWQYQAEHFVQMIKSCRTSFQRKHGVELVHAFLQEDIRRKEVARAQQSMIMLGALTAESAPRCSPLVNAPPAGWPAFGHSVRSFDLTLHFSGDNIGGTASSMGKRRHDYTQDGQAPSQSSVHKRSRLALPPRLQNQ